MNRATADSTPHMPKHGRVPRSRVLAAITAFFAAALLRLGERPASAAPTLQIQNDGDTGLVVSVVGGATGIYGTSDTGIAIQAASSDGTGVYAQSKKGIGILGHSDSNTGIYAESHNGLGLFSSSDSNTAVRAESRTGIGIIGQSNSNTGIYADSGSGIALYCYSGTNTCVYAEPGSDKAYAGWFTGKVGIKGALEKYGGGQFKIDHPLDPANKYLCHSFVESPDAKNIYDGVTILDSNGEAVVELPDWFEPLNTDLRYQLTAIGAPGPHLHIAKEVKDRSFKVAGGAAGSKVSWQVTGTRQDAWAVAHPSPVEEEKPVEEKGYYLHPELFGAPEERGIEWARHPEAMLRARETRQKLTAGPPLPSPAGTLKMPGFTG